MSNRTNKKLNSLGSALLLFSGAVLHTSAHAELKAIDDETLSKVDGKAGLTIDIDMGISIGEFMYKDAGAITMQGIRMGGMTRCGDTNGENGTVGQDTWCSGDNEVGTAFGKNGENKIVASVADRSSALHGSYGGGGGAGGSTGLNNVRINVDIAGDGTTVDRIYDTGILDPINGGTYTIPIYDHQFFWAWGELAAANLSCEAGGPKCQLLLKDGDLFLHGSASDVSIVSRSYQAVDFGFELDRFAIQASDYKPGDDLVNGLTGNETDTTTLYSNLKMEGFFGGFDLLIENDGNGFGAIDADLDGRISDAENLTSTGYGDANSKIVINQFFEITEMEYDFDIVGIRYEKMRMHNLRGNDDMFDFDQSDFANAATSQGFAQANTQIYAVKDNIVQVRAGLVGGNPLADTAFVDGVTFNARLVADMDIDHLSFGDTDQSIGLLRWTDMDIMTKQTFSAH